MIGIVLLYFNLNILYWSCLEKIMSDLMNYRFLEKRLAFLLAI